MRTSFHHQPEAQHPKSSAIHKFGPADYPIFGSFATEPSRTKIQRYPLLSESDQILWRSEMTLSANSGHRAQKRCSAKVSA